ncbi:YqhA family protein [Tropicimonas isoalkanivorans]|uniref:Uncharacterized membrane protein YqhA n=1 Tax=Tropicimonas isoalkanivorans TaxID=441112 RepID=A0A1I1LQJ3_9RHOB|nr:YqhA family protein [Tropicimonas isoalkanivorans]SFC71740.1 Uncharacterized membrane protein YqhA [Tropicimonas isoalkanivorans]
MKIRDIERRIVVSTRYLTVVAVFGSLAAAVLMFLLGFYNIIQAFVEGWKVPESGGHSEEATSFGAASVISVIEGLDRFLIAIVLLYFGYGVYTLFLHPEESEETLALPQWLRVRQIGQLKQVVAEVIIVVLLVLFLRLALQAFENPTIELSFARIATMMVLPVSILLLSLALRFVELHPKPDPRDMLEPKRTPRQQEDDDE